MEDKGCIRLIKELEEKYNSLSNQQGYKIEAERRDILKKIEKLEVKYKYQL